MKKTIIIGMLFLTLAACAPQPGSAMNTGNGQTPEGNAILAESNWSLVSFGEVGAETPIIEDSAITLEFDAEGQAFGSGGCNGYSTQYEVQGDQLSFSEITSTLIACDSDGLGKQEQQYFQTLETAGKFELAENNLTIWYNDGQGVLNWQNE